MKKFWNKIYAFWVFSVKNRTRQTLELGGFKVRFREYDMTVSSLSKNFKLTLRADCHPFGYLSVSAKQGKMDNIRGYAVMMYLLSTCMTQDERLNKEVTRALQRYNYRLEALASTKVNEESDADVAHKANLEAERAETENVHLTRAQRREKEREMRKIIRKEYGNKAKDADKKTSTDTENE